ncbi:mitochondrial thiamine pyrophosphate carrier [Leptopilina boulardi]|uniref:mitochondrial thiamine pyrophosphate carrier n=1 Tax=Leptopilina boulardi TaxID=63433 RepID=UPI0021F600E7|nr:mitochondrial thiamine pyrophosphate carrier [Leptopilina boulardi]XP_051173553.1 mitochondrial thiamine pyrophosphate carrier [Leptopilina boulardi]
MDESLKLAEPSSAAFAGAVSGCITRLLFQPLDVVKTRFQLQVEPIKHHSVSKYRSLPQAFALIVKEEGVSALWKGHVPAQLLSIVYGMSQFYSYNLITQHLNRYQIVHEWRNTLHFAEGAIAGAVSTTLTFPFDTIRTRLIAQSTKHKVYHGLFHSCLSIFREESSKAFFRGLLPTILQIAPHTAFQFYFFGIFKDLYVKITDDSSTSIAGTMTAGSLAGLAAKTIIYPFDLIRKRLQIQGFQHGRKGFGVFFHCTGMKDCVIITIKREGVNGLFKGLVPSQVKAVVTTALHFTIYEQTLVIMQILKEKY